MWRSEHIGLLAAVLPNNFWGGPKPAHALQPPCGPARRNLQVPSPRLTRVPTFLRNRPVQSLHPIRAPTFLRNRPVQSLHPIRVPTCHPSHRVLSLHLTRVPIFRLSRRAPKCSTARSFLRPVERSSKTTLRCWKSRKSPPPGASYWMSFWPRQN